MERRLDLEFFLSISGSSRSCESSRWLEGDAAGDSSGISPLLLLVAGPNADRFLSSSSGLSGGGAILAPELGLGRSRGH
jgi:hypothetical protein